MTLLRVAIAASSSSLPLFNAQQLRSVPFRQRGNGFVVCATKGSNNNRALTGVLFEPFEEVKKELDLVSIVPQVSLARQKYHDESEAAVNEQIKFFKESSEEERGHAEKLMEYQVLSSIPPGAPQARISGSRDVKEQHPSPALSASQISSINCPRGELERKVQR